MKKEMFNFTLERKVDTTGQDNNEVEIYWAG